MKFIQQFIILLFIVFFSSCINPDKSSEKKGIIIENAEFSLMIGNDGTALSLVHKASGQECLQQGTKTPMFAIKQNRPYQNELFLSLPTKETTFYSDSAYLQGEKLIVTFDKILYKATIDLNITDYYIGFKFESLEIRHGETLFRDREAEAMIDELTLIQLPVKKRNHFGGWLNVSWDEDVAVNLLGTDPFCKIDAESRDGYYIMKAQMDKTVKLFDVGAALITTNTDNLLNCIDKVEEDYDLPRGVKSRRDPAYNYSYYEIYKVNTQNIDEHIEYAIAGGFKGILIYYIAFAESMGHFPWLPDYPNGMEDLKTITGKIREAGLIPGFHIHYNKAMKNDSYVTPVPDPRLRLERIFTLKGELDEKSTTVFIEENPEGSTLADGRRLLKLGDELVEYSKFTKKPPYQFQGCKRAVLGTKTGRYPNGFKFGLLDVDNWHIFIRFDQNTSIQQEVGKRVADIYNEAGFEFVYFDGAEDVHNPFWFHVGNSQNIVYQFFDQKPLFSEGAAKSHFGWHILTRANAFDVYPAEMIKSSVERHMVHEAKMIQSDFSKLNFGWNTYSIPDDETVGMQPDMYEYVCCRATAWGCPISLIGNLENLRSHPRTSDNLQAMRKWEEARLKGVFSEEQIQNMKNPDQEFTLLIDEKGNYELLPWWQLTGMPLDSSDVRSFYFERNNKSWIAYWHSDSSASISLDLDPNAIRLYEKPGEEIPISNEKGALILPADKIRYLETGLSRKDLEKIFKELQVL